MTNLEALTATVNYPIESFKVEKLLIDQKLDATTVYSGTSKAFDLATASMYQLIATSANISEGDMQISVTEKTTFLKLASAIYEKHGVIDPLANNTIRNRSHYW